MTLASSCARRALAALAVTAIAIALAACTPSASQSQSPLKPRLSPPTIRTDATLRAGVDLSYAPFAGVVGEQDAGIDIDVAEAIAGRLGLKPEFVDVPSSRISSALAEGEADIVLSSPYSSDVLSRSTIAGTYLSDGPTLFAGATGVSGAATSSIVASSSTTIGVQKYSEAYWLLSADRGVDNLAVYPTLREAFAALGRKEVAYVAGDAIVGAYIARDESGVRYVGAIAPARLLGVAVLADDSKLADAVRSTLDAMAADGILATIRTTWVGTLPELPLASADTSAPMGSDLATP